MVAPYIAPDNTSQDWASWRSGLDGAIVAGARIAVAFLPQAQATPNMTVRVLAGPLMIGGVLTEIAAQNTGTIAAPTTNPRIDRIVLNPATGAIQVVTGTEAASPVAPAIPAERLPIARFQLAVGATAIPNSLIIDERVMGGGGSVGANSITLDRLARVGTAGQVLTSGGAGADPSYQAVPLPFGYLSGLTLARNSGTPTTHLDIAAGAARNSTDAANLTLAATLTKRLDAAWAVGTGNGGLDTGSRAANTWYHVHAIRRPDTGIVDALFSLSATAPTLPTNYTQFRRLGSIRTDGSSNILAFIQDGDRFVWDVPSADYNQASPGTSAVLASLRVPTGVSVLAIITGSVQGDGTSGIFFLITDPAQTDTTPSISAFTTYSNNADAAADPFQVEVRTNTSGQIRHRQTLGNRAIVIITHGWIDNRGKG